MGRAATALRRARWRGLAAAAVLASAAASASAPPVTPWPEVPEPPRAKSEWVAEDMRVNGLPTRISRFESELSPEEMLAYYRAHWSQAEVGPPRETRVSGWQNIATLHGPFQIVVQVKPQEPRGSQGFVSVANIGEADADFIPKWLPTRDLDVLQVNEATDGPKRNAFVNAVSKSDFDASVRRQRDEWQRRGWATDGERRETGQDGTRVYYASFSKPPQTLDLTVTQPAGQRATFLTLNLVEPADKARR